MDDRQHVSYTTPDDAQEMCTCATHTILKDDTGMRVDVAHNTTRMHTDVAHDDTRMNTDATHKEAGTCTNVAPDNTRIYTDATRPVPKTATNIYAYARLTIVAGKCTYPDIVKKFACTS